MRILVPGAAGCVGRAVSARGDSHGMQVVAVPHEDLDVTADGEPARALRRWSCDAVLFCAAFTVVDRTDGRAFAVNVEAPARWARAVPTWWLSSNLVMDGWGPHAVGSAPRPRGAYAEQKAEGERRVLDAGGHVVRVGWVYGPGGRTFASRLCSRLRAGETVRAVSDVVVRPTWSEDLADALLKLPRGLTHLAARGETSWYAFALAVQARLGAGRVVPIRQTELDLAEPRPRDGRLEPAELAPWWERVEPLIART